MTDIDTGLNVWQMTSNHNRMSDLQADTMRSVRKGRKSRRNPHQAMSGRAASK